MATYQFYGQAQMPSTRYKDLVDLVAIVTEASVVAEDQRAALWSEAERRGLSDRTDSSFQIEPSGSEATVPRPVALSSLSSARWTKHCQLSVPSRTRSSTARRQAAGIRKAAHGATDSPPKSRPRSIYAIQITGDEYASGGLPDGS